VLEIIRDTRLQQKLGQFRQEVIQQIKNELTRDPLVRNEELDEPD